MNENIKPLLELKEKVKALAQKAFEKGKIDPRPVKDPNSKWFGKKDEYLRTQAAFYQCSKCSKPYFGGLADCERDL